MLIAQTKNHYYYPTLENKIRSFYHSYSNNGDDLYDQHYYSNSSPSFTDPKYLQNQGSKSDTVIETEIKTVPAGIIIHSVNIRPTDKDDDNRNLI